MSWLPSILEVVARVILPWLAGRLRRGPENASSDRALRERLLTRVEEHWRTA